jgi:hypothetical protein
MGYPAGVGDLLRFRIPCYSRLAFPFPNICNYLHSGSKALRVSQQRRVFFLGNKRAIQIIAIPDPYYKDYREKAVL